MTTAAPTTFAAEKADFGFYNIGSDDRVMIKPVSSDGITVTAVSRNVDGEPGDERFYPGSQSLRVTVSDTAPGKMYILTVAAEDMVYYVDQQTGGSTISFTALFQLPAKRTDMVLSIGSNTAGFTRISIPLSYTPKAEGDAVTPEPGSEMKTGYLACLKDSACVMAAYSDLDRSSWYHDGVHFALENHVMNGVGEQMFEPNTPASRAMIVTMLWRKEGEPVVNHTITFTDVPSNTWYTEAVRWAAGNKIVEGYSTERFAPGENVSREQLATILWRFAKYKGTDSSPANPVNLSIYADAEHISGWAHGGMKWAVSTGLITGVGNDRLSPETDATRAQVATMLMRYYVMSR